MEKLLIKNFVQKLFRSRLSGDGNGLHRAFTITSQVSAKSSRGSIVGMVRYTRVLV